MRPWIIPCLVGTLLLAACSSDSKDATGQGGAGAGAGAGGFGAGAGGRGAGAAVPGSQEDLVQSAGDRIFFATDQSSLSPDARVTLDKQADWLQRNTQVGVWIAGNCDERGTEEYNLALGQRRATATRDYLVARGVAQPRMETISYGKTRPIESASTPEAWSQNRNAITSVK